MYIIDKNTDTNIEIDKNTDITKLDQFFDNLEKSYKITFDCYNIENINKHSLHLFVDFDYENNILYIENKTILLSFETNKNIDLYINY